MNQEEEKCFFLGMMVSDAICYGVPTMAKRARKSGAPIEYPLAALRLLKIIRAQYSELATAPV